jgi:CHAT domain-containing protein
MKIKQKQLFLLILGFFVCFLIGLTPNSKAAKKVATAEKSTSYEVQAGFAVARRSTLHSPFKKQVDWGQNTKALTRLERAYSYYWQGKYEEAIAIWENLLKTRKGLDAATIYNYLGIANREVGQLGRSISHFREAIAIYRENDEEATRTSLTKTLIEQGRTFNEMGQWKRSRPLLEEAISMVESDLSLKFLASRALGTSYWLEGNFDKAVEASLTSRNLALLANDSQAIAIALNDLTNVLLLRRKQYLSQIPDVTAEGDEAEASRLEFLAEQDKLAAIDAANKTVKNSRGTQGLFLVRAMLNLSKLSPQRDYRSGARKILTNTPSSRTKAELLIDLSLQEEENTSIALLKDAIATADKVGARRIQSIGYLRLSELYERTGKYQQALIEAERGEWIAQQLMASDILYRFQWLSGKVYRKIGNNEKAITSYQNAIAFLQRLRKEQNNTLSYSQLGLKQSIEPVYRELISLLLMKDSPKSIKDALDAFQELQLSQLQSFFGDACLELRQKTIDSPVSYPKKAAIIHTIILNNSTYTILELSNGKIYAYPIRIEATELEERLKQWRRQLEDTAIPEEFLELSQDFYNLLIRPLERDLTANRAFYDGKQFLIEKYPVSITLGFNLPSRALSILKEKASIFGLSVALRKDNSDLVEFPSLPYVKNETLQVQNIVGGERLLDRDFSQTNFEKELVNNRRLVHVATHGEFNGTLAKTFLRTFDRSLPLSELERIFRTREQPIDLLTLSACDTASGNNKAILGLAGVALRSDVKNVMASLWAIEDKSTTELVANFYRHLEKGMSVARALQIAQIARLKNDYVTQWSAFIAIQN